MEMTRGEINDHLAKFAADNPQYKDALLKDPRNVIEQQFGINIPDNVDIEVVQDSASKVHIVLPHTVESGAELSDDDLEAVAGGANVKEANCDDGIASTVVEIQASLI